MSYPALCAHLGWKSPPLFGDLVPTLGGRGKSRVIGSSKPKRDPRSGPPTKVVAQKRSVQESHQPKAMLRLGELLAPTDVSDTACHGPVGGSQEVTPLFTKKREGGAVPPPKPPTDAGSFRCRDFRLFEAPIVPETISVSPLKPVVPATLDANMEPVSKKICPGIFVPKAGAFAKSRVAKRQEANRAKAKSISNKIERQRVRREKRNKRRYPWRLPGYQQGCPTCGTGGGTWRECLCSTCSID